MDFFSFFFKKIRPDVGHIGFRENGHSVRNPAWHPPKFDWVWFGQHLSQIWRFWKKLNQNIPKAPDYMDWRESLERARESLVFQVRIGLTYGSDVALMYAPMHALSSTDIQKWRTPLLTLSKKGDEATGAVHISLLLHLFFSGSRSVGSDSPSHQ